MVSTRLALHDAVILDSSDMSDEVNLGFETLVGFYFPVGFTGGDTITLNASVRRGGEHAPMRDYALGTAITIATGGAAGSFTPVPPSIAAAVQNFRIESASAVSEDTVITVIARSIS